MNYPEYEPTAEEDESFNAMTLAQQQENEHRRWEAEQTRDLQLEQEVRQMTINQLARHVVSGETHRGDWASIALIAKWLGCTVPEYVTEQPRDYT